MADHIAGFVGIGVILLLIAFRFPVGLALGGVALGGLFWLLGVTPTLGLLGSVP